MRLVVYEWCCSGGLAAAESAFAPGVATALHREGRAMFLALLRDAVRDPRLAVTAVVDATRPLPLPAGVRLCPVAAGAEVSMLVVEAARADLTIVVAPETDGLLASRVAAVRQGGGAVVAPDASFIAVAADKQATIQALAAAGLPVPPGRDLGPRAAWPAEFVRPAVRKLRDGVGGDGLIVVAAGAAPPEPAAGATRAEAWLPGVPVGVSCLCGPGGAVPLVPLRQFCSDSGRRYLGGAPLPDEPRRRRAAALAVRSIAAVAAAAGGAALGWVGVDMLLGGRDDGRADRVLEVNPRLTTSFVGHAAGAATSVVRDLISVAAGLRVGPAAPPAAFQVGADDDSSSPAD